MTRATAGPMTVAERYAFDVSGFLVRRGVLSSSDVRVLNDAVNALAVPAPGASLQSQRFVGHLPAAPAFRALLDHPGVFDVLVELCGPTLRLDHTYGIVMTPGTTGLSLHGGGTPFDPAEYYLVHGDRISCGLVAVQWCLVDHVAGSGGFRCVPGSHKASFPLPDAVPEDLLVELELGAGDVVVFTEALTHATAPWRAPFQRRCLMYKYAPGHLSWGRDEVLPDELGPLLTERQRRLFEPPYVKQRAAVTDAASPAAPRRKSWTRRPSTGTA